MIVFYFTYLCLINDYCYTSESVFPIIIFLATRKISLERKIVLVHIMMCIIKLILKDTSWGDPPLSQPGISNLGLLLQGERQGFNFFLLNEANFEKDSKLTTVPTKLPHRSGLVTTMCCLFKKHHYFLNHLTDYHLKQFKR